MKKFFNFLFGALLGGFAGAFIALLLAPESGSAMRQKIYSFLISTSDEIKAAAEEKRIELEEELRYLSAKL